MDHFARVCCKPPVAKQKVGVKAIQDKPLNESSSEDEYLYHVHDEKSRLKQPVLEVTFQNNKLEMLVDTGAAVNAIDKSRYDSLSDLPILDTTNKQLFGYDKKQIEIS